MRFLKSLSDDIKRKSKAVHAMGQAEQSRPLKSEKLYNNVKLSPSNGAGMRNNDAAVMKMQSEIPTKITGCLSMNRAGGTTKRSGLTLTLTNRTATAAMPKSTVAYHGRNPRKWNPQFKLPGKKYPLMKKKNQCEGNDNGICEKVTFHFSCCQEATDSYGSPASSNKSICRVNSNDRRRAEGVT